MIKNHRGQSLTELLIAAAVLGFSIVAISTFVVTQNHTDTNIQGQTACRGYVQTILNDFSDASGTRIINYIPGTVGAVRTPALTAPRVEQNYYTLTPVTPPAPAGASAKYAFRRFFQNIDNATTRAYQIYMGDTTYCSAPKPLTAAVLNNPNILTALTNARFAATIRLEPFDLTANQPIATATCNTPPDIRPLAGVNGGNTAAAGWVPNPNNYGIKVSVTVTGNENKWCQGSKILSYTPDTAPPNVAFVDAPWPTFLSTCTTGEYYGVLASSEPSSFFVCLLNQPPSHTSQTCQSYIFPAATPPVISLTVTNQGPGFSDTMTIYKATGVVGSFNLFTRAIDSASNLSLSNASRPIKCPCNIANTFSGTQNIVTHSDCIGPPDATWIPGGERLWYKAVPPGPAFACYPKIVQYSAAPAADTLQPQCAVALRTCSDGGDAWSSWSCTGCTAGFHLFAGFCVADPCLVGLTEACVGADPNANYSKMCGVGSVWGPCNCTTCRDSFGGHIGACGSCALAPGAWRCSVQNAPAGTPNNWCDLSKTGKACGPLGTTTAGAGGIYPPTSWPVVRTGIDLTCDPTAVCLANPQLCAPK